MSRFERRRRSRIDASASRAPETAASYSAQNSRRHEVQAALQDCKHRAPAHWSPGSAAGTSASLGPDSLGVLLGKVRICSFYAVVFTPVWNSYAHRVCLAELSRGDFQMFRVCLRSTASAVTALS